MPGQTNFLTTSTSICLSPCHGLVVSGREDRYHICPQPSSRAKPSNNQAMARTILRGSVLVRCQILSAMSSKLHLTTKAHISYEKQQHGCGLRWHRSTARDTSHGPNHFRCLVMGYKGSNAHVQRHMDAFLRPLDGPESYVDDVVQADASFDLHLHNLRALFTIFQPLSLLKAAFVLHQELVGHTSTQTTSNRRRLIDALSLPI